MEKQQQQPPNLYPAVQGNVPPPGNYQAAPGIVSAPSYSVATGTVVQTTTVITTGVPLRDWKHDICGCFNNFPFCLLTFFCLCISEYMLAKKARHFNDGLWIILMYLGYFAVLFFEMAIGVVVSADYVGFFQLLRLIIAIGLLLCMVVLRMRIRQERNIFGSSIGDCCYVFWCRHCTTCQEYQELDTEDTIIVHQ